MAASHTYHYTARPSAVALGKRREVSTSVHLCAQNTRPYATPTDLSSTAQTSAPPTPAHLPSAPSDAHFYESTKIGVSEYASMDYTEQLYSILALPPVTALAALAARIPGANFTAEHSSLVELCCICPSFWEGVEDAQPLAADNKGPFTRFWDEKRGSNAELAALGSSMLRLFVAEHLQTTYPHLPERVMRDVMELYVGPVTTSDMARRWGVFAGKTSAPREMTANEIRNKHGLSAGQGLLRWYRNPQDIQQIDLETGKSRSIGMFTHAMSSVANAIVGAVFQEHGWDQTRRFITRNWLYTKPNLDPYLKWKRPNMVLMETLIKYSRAPAETQLLRESGRDSDSPIFVVGLFSEETQLGEGTGNSLRLAEWRAAEDALRRIYTTHLLGSDKKWNSRAWPNVPSATLAAQKSYQPDLLGDDEVEYGRAQSPFMQGQETVMSLFRQNHRPPRALTTPHAGQKQDAATRKPTRPTTGVGSVDPSLPLEHRVPKFQRDRVAGGPAGRREKGNDRPAKETQPDSEQWQSPYNSPFAQESLPSWPKAEADEIKRVNDYT